MVLGRGLSQSSREEIEVWKFVEYYDLDTFFLPVKLPESQGNKTLFMWDFLTRRHSTIIFASLGIIFTTHIGLNNLTNRLFNDGVVRTQQEDQLEIEGYTRKKFWNMYSEFLSCQVNCSLDQSSFSTVARKSTLSDFGAIRSDSRYSCFILVRTDLLYNRSATTFFDPANAQSILRASNKTKIAFLIPANNQKFTRPEETPLLTTFIPNLIQSIAPNEWDVFQIIIYLGFDHGDPLLDGPKSMFMWRTITLALLNTSIIVKYHSFPRTNWVTFIWNSLFVSAYRDGADYFYQCGDDTKLSSFGWATKFVSTLRANDDFGVTGPNDRGWSCQLLTQAFVARKHYDIFNWFFPPEIPNYFSDNWVSCVYEQDTFCEKEHTIDNTIWNRYPGCYLPKTMIQTVAVGKLTIQQWQQKEKVGNAKRKENVSNPILQDPKKCFTWADGTNWNEDELVRR